MSVYNLTNHTSILQIGQGAQITQTPTWSHTQDQDKQGCESMYVQYMKHTHSAGLMIDCTVSVLSKCLVRVQTAILLVFVLYVLYDPHTMQGTNHVRAVIELGSILATYSQAKVVLRIISPQML